MSERDWIYVREALEDRRDELHGNIREGCEPECARVYLDDADSYERLMDSQNLKAAVLALEPQGETPEKQP